MKTIHELHRKAAPAGRPVPQTFHDGSLWIGCWDTAKLYRLDPTQWSVLEEVELPGKPYGLASLDGALRINIGVGDEDDRYIYSFKPGTPLNQEDRIPCPELSGAHLATYAGELFLVQVGNQQVLKLAPNGDVTQKIQLPSRCGGLCFAGATAYMISTDDEWDDLYFTKINLQAAVAELEVLATVPAEARGLAFDGNNWWTSYRELNQIGTFSLTS